jgi:serine O-acetyltransferase
VLENLRHDIARLREIKTKPYVFMVLESLLFENGFQAVVLHRMAHWFKSRGIPFFGPCFGRLALFLTGVEIAPGASIGPGLMISHGNGIVIGQWSRLGSQCTLMQQVTLGAPGPGRLAEMPRLGDRVFVGAGARLIGGIEIGDDCFIGANAVVGEDIPANSRVVLDIALKIRPRSVGIAPHPPTPLPADGKGGDPKSEG